MHTPTYIRTLLHTRTRKSIHPHAHVDIHPTHPHTPHTPMCIRTYCGHAQNPPSGVKLCMEAVCIMKGLKPDRKPDPNSGKMVEDFWGPSLKLLGDLKFLESLKTYDKDNINPAIMKRVREKWVILHNMRTCSVKH